MDDETDATQSSPAKPPRRWSPFGRGWRGVLLRLPLVYLVIVGIAAALQRTLMYPGGGRGDDMSVAAYADAVPDAEDVTATTADGVTLHGWHVLARPESARAARAERPTVLFFHGNGGHRAHRAWVYRLWNELGCDVIAFDYRGYGENAGSPSEAGLLADAGAMWRYATEEAGLTADRIVLYGASLGGGVAIGLAHDLAENGVSPRGLFVRSTFSSMVDAAAGQYPFLPVRWVLLDRYESAAKIGTLICPVLMFHGDRDRSVSIDLGRRLFAAAPETSASGVPKQFVTIEGAGHNDLLQVAGGRFERTIREWLDAIETPRKPEA